MRARFLFDDMNFPFPDDLVNLLLDLNSISQSNNEKSDVSGLVEQGSPTVNAPDIISSSPLVPNFTTQSYFAAFENENSTAMPHITTTLSNQLDTTQTPAQTSSRITVLISNLEINSQTGTEKTESEINKNVASVHEKLDLPILNQQGTVKVLPVNKFGEHYLNSTTAWDFNQSITTSLLSDGQFTEVPKLSSTRIVDLKSQNEANISDFSHSTTNILKSHVHKHNNETLYVDQNESNKQINQEEVW